MSNLKSQQNHKILFTGGGSSGHVTPNLALIPHLQELGFTIEYIGSKQGIEKGIVEEAGIPYYGISSGKLRRYFSWRNLTDPFRIIWGTLQAFFLIRSIRPRVVFSKGGFVSCPVVWAAWLNRVPVVIHESDMTPGLANRLSAPFARIICLTFPESMVHISKRKARLTGLPLRDFLNSGNAEKGMQFCGFESPGRTILVMGGSQGANRINQVLRQSLPQLLEKYRVVHLCGHGKLDPALEELSGYAQFEYIGAELPDLFALSDIVISRAGSTSINEIVSLKKLNLLIPLPRQSSRGDQILNAASFEKQGLSRVIPEEQLSTTSLLEGLTHLENHTETFHKNLEGAKNKNGIQNIIEILMKFTQNYK